MSGDLAVQCSKLIEWYHRSDFCFPNEFVLPLVYIYRYIYIYIYIYTLYYYIGITYHLCYLCYHRFE